MNHILRSFFAGKRTDCLVDVIQIELVRADLAERLSAGGHHLKAQLECRVRRTLHPFHRHQLAAETARRDFLIARSDLRENSVLFRR